MELSISKENKQFIPTYKDQKIGWFEKPDWTPGQYLVQPREMGRSYLGKFEGASLDPKNFVRQTDGDSFIEFESIPTQHLTGFTGVEMRSNGCGITSTYDILSTLAGDGFHLKYPTVGKFAIHALSRHKNDITALNGRIVKKGSPVFNSEKGGWYHDALIYLAQEFAVHGERYENIGLNTFAEQFAERTKNNVQVMGLISVDTNSWFVHQPADAGRGKHLVIVSGFKFDRPSKVGEVLISDVYDTGEKADQLVDRTQKPINIWVKENAIIGHAYAGNAILFNK
jgi:hypothetical protein